MKTWIAVAAALLLPAALATAQDEDPAGNIDELIRQLGSEDFATREKATEELRKIGRPAEEALRKAAESEDAEVQSRARTLLRALEKPAKEEKEEEGPRVELRPGLQFNLQGFRGGSLVVQSTNDDSTYRLTPADGSDPLVFHRSAGGAVKLEYTDEKGAKKTAGAESLEKFLEEHKELAAKYGITKDGINYKGLRTAFAAGGRNRVMIQPGLPFRLPGGPGGDEDDDRPRRFEWNLEDLMGGRDRAAGATLEKPSEALRAHIEIPGGEGLVVTRVEPGSAAEAAGLLRHDVLLEIDGENVRSVQDARRRLGKASRITVIRKGLKRTIQAERAGKERDF